MNPFAVSQFTTWKLGFAQDLRLYRQAGIEAIEVCEAKMDAADPLPQIHLLQESGLRLASVQPRFHSPFPNSLRAAPAAPGERMDLLRGTIRLFGRHFPGTVLVLNTGLAPKGRFAEAHEVAVREFRKVAPFAADHGVRLAIEPLNPIYMNTDTFVCTLARGGRMIEEVDHPAFGLCLDLWHYWEEPDAAARIRQYRDRIFCVHISDWRTPRAFADRLLPGRGEMPVVPMLQTIRRAGYRGDYTLEIFSDLKLKDSLWRNPEKTVREGKRAWDKLWPKVLRG